MLPELSGREELPVRYHDVNNSEIVAVSSTAVFTIVRLRLLYSLRWENLVLIIGTAALNRTFTVRNRNTSEHMCKKKSPGDKKKKHRAIRSQSHSVQNMHIFVHK